MKKILTILMLVSLVFASRYRVYSVKDYVKAFNSLSLQQQKLLYEVFKRGEVVDLQYTLTAIAWKESMAGLAKVNMWDGDGGSCGVFHNRLKSVFGRHKEWRWTRVNANMVCTRLVENLDFAFTEAVAEIRYWQKVRGENNWMSIWASYNAGIHYKSAQAKAYAANIRNMIKAIRYLVADKWENSVEFVKIKKRIKK